MDQQKWPEWSSKIAEIFKLKSRDEWCALLEGSEVCFAPLLTIAESRQHPHAIARESYIEIDGVSQPQPAPRFSRSEAEIRRPAAKAGEDTDEILLEMGVTADQISSLRDNGTVA